MYPFRASRWAVWNERNNVFWKSLPFKPLNVAHRTLSLLEEYQSFHPKAVKKKGRQLTKWELPPRGRLKLNCDGAFQLATGRGGIGVVIRDSNGRSVAMLARSFMHANSALDMEAEACRAGLLLGIAQGWSDLDIESDSSVLVAALTHKREDLSEVGCIVSDCKRYLAAFSSFSVRHIFQEANSVADRLAHFACSEVIDSCWFEEPPNIIQ